MPFFHRSHNEVTIVASSCVNVATALKASKYDDDDDDDDDELQLHGAEGASERAL